MNILKLNVAIFSSQSSIRLGEMNEYLMQRSFAMTFMSRSYLKLFSSFLLIATILLVAGCLGTPGKGVSRKSDGDTNRPVSGKNVQSMFYKAQHQETGNMWDVWPHAHGTG